ncbi:MAG: class I SAM-dependent methyltransferase [Alphaproteobacteria bacterium]
MKDKQNFDKYADIKPFNDTSNPVWERLCVRLTDLRGQTIKNFCALDYGCGDGKYLPRFQAYGITPDNIYGHEVSEIRVQRCREKGWKNILYVPLHQTLPFEDHKFDLVNLTEVIEHIPAQETDFYLQDIRRMTKSDGIVLVSTPNYPIKRFNDWFNVVVNRMWKRVKDDPTHVTFYKPRSLQRRLQKFFPHVAVLCYKEGVFYPRIKHPLFMHKIIAVASPSPIPAELLEGEISALSKAT